jgi:hypothetical protein
MRRLVSVVLVAFAGLAPRGALAEDPPAGAPPQTTAAPQAQADPGVAPPDRTTEEALATDLFTAARELMAEGRHAEACPKLVESARLSKKVGTYGKLAECDEKMGRLVAARADFQQALNLARAQGDERLPIVEKELARVDAIVPRLRLSLTGSPPAGLEISVDGVEVGTGLLGTPIPLDPGRHKVVATAPGRQPWTASVELSADGKTTSLPVPALSSAQPAVTAAPPPAGRSPMAIGGIAATGVGVAAVGLGAFFGGLAQARTDESNRAGCAGDLCDADGAEIRNSARAAGDVSTALFITGGALLAGGLTLWLLGTDPRATTAPAARSGGSMPVNTTPAGQGGSGSPGPRGAPAARVGLHVSLTSISIQGSL